MVDVCTRFCILKPLLDKKKKKKRQSVAGAIVDTLSLLSYPRHFVCSDNSTEFKNEIPENHPSANGIAERFVQSTKKVLEKCLESTSEDWHHYIKSTSIFKISNNQRKLLLIHQ